MGFTLINQFFFSTLQKDIDPPRVVVQLREVVILKSRLVIAERDDPHDTICLALDE
jgi:hypothetical protein